MPRLIQKSLMNSSFAEAVLKALYRTLPSGADMFLWGKAFTVPIWISFCTCLWKDTVVGQGQMNMKAGGGQVTGQSGSVVECRPIHQSVVGSIPRRGTYLDGRFHPWPGCLPEATDRCFCLTLMFLSLSKNNQ